MCRAVLPSVRRSGSGFTSRTAPRQFPRGYASLPVVDSHTTPSAYLDCYRAEPDSSQPPSAGRVFTHKGLPRPFRHGPEVRRAPLRHQAGRKLHFSVWSEESRPKDTSGSTKRHRNPSRAGLRPKRVSSCPEEGHRSATAEPYQVAVVILSIHRRMQVNHRSFGVSNVFSLSRPRRNASG